ncbi:MAG: hypothetical protein ACLP19_05420 [Xanthobacteraceae bacterium]
MDEQDRKYLNAQIEWAGSRLQEGHPITSVMEGIITGIAVFFKNQAKWTRKSED